MQAADLAVATLGPCGIDSPLKPLIDARKTPEHYVDEFDRVLFHDTLGDVTAVGLGPADLPGFEPAGPRRSIFFDPAKLRVGIVTCGGLCPGINDVIRGLVMELSFHYGVQRIHGFRNGHQGFKTMAECGTKSNVARRVDDSVAIASITPFLGRISIGGFRPKRTLVR